MRWRWNETFASVPTSTRQVPEVSTLGDLLIPLCLKSHSKLENIAEQCDELSRRNVLWRFLQQGVDQKSLSSIKQDLQSAVQQFQVPNFFQILICLYIENASDRIPSSPKFWFAVSRSSHYSQIRCVEYLIIHMPIFLMHSQQIKTLWMLFPSLFRMLAGETNTFLEVAVMLSKSLLTG